LVVVTGFGATASLGSETVAAAAVVQPTGLVLTTTLANVLVWGKVPATVPSTTWTPITPANPDIWTEIKAA